MNWRPEFPHVGRAAAAVAVGMVLVMVLCLAIVGAVIGGGSVLFGAGQSCTGGTSTSANGAAAAQPTASAAGRATIPADYLQLYQQAGKKYGVPWVVLAGIGKVESNEGRTTLPGVHSGANAFGAAGPMQIGIGGASGNTWGGAPVHPASEQVAGVATDGNGDGIASVYEPADAIAGAAKYLVAHGVQNNVSGAIFAYNHLTSYVQSVLHWAGVYASGGFSGQRRHHRRGGHRRPVPGQRRPWRWPWQRAGAEPGGGHGDRVRPVADRQAVPVGRHRAGRVRLLGPDDDGLPGGRHQHPAHLGGAVDVGPQGRARP